MSHFFLRRHCPFVSETGNKSKLFLLTHVFDAKPEKHNQMLSCSKNSNHSPVEQVGKTFVFCYFSTFFSFFPFQTELRNVCEVFRCLFLRQCSREEEGAS